MMSDSSKTDSAQQTDPAQLGRAEVRVPTPDLDGDLRFLTTQFGFRLDRIWPADEPAFAALSGHGLGVLLERSDDAAKVTLRLHSDDPTRFAGGVTKFTSPGGHRIEVEAARPALIVPKASRDLVVHRLAGDDAWGIGRAGMHYRDLIPDRLGGALIASHIRIPDGGPVDDMVHFHTIRFQLIFCHRGWVRLVYEDQGDPFVLREGDCVIQPPEIRHRVLEASKGLEVIELGVPADHITTIDHDMELPTPEHRPGRDFAGTRFVLHREAEAEWTPWRVPGFELRETGIGEATRGIAEVQIARRGGSTEPSPRDSRFTPHASIRSDADILFGFVRNGTMTLCVEEQAHHELAPGDAFALPPDMTANLVNPSDDLELLEVTLVTGV